MKVVMNCYDIGYFCTLLQQVLAPVKCAACFALNIQAGLG